MGASESFQVVLCLHAVNNIQHDDNESYYGMVSGSMDKFDSAGVSVTSERRSTLIVGKETVLTLRVFLHKQGAHSSTDRPVGHLAIPIQKISYGGIYQTWFILDESGPGHTDIARQNEQFMDAFLSLRGNDEATMEKLRLPRVCLTILKSKDYADWLQQDEGKHQDYHDMVLRSHEQLREMCQRYCDLIDSLEETGQLSRLPVIGEDSQPVPAGAVKADDLRDRLVGVLQQRQNAEVDAGKRIGELQREMDDVLAKANDQLEARNATIVALKAEGKQLQVQIKAQELENMQATERYTLQKQRNQSLRDEDNQETPASVSEEAYWEAKKELTKLQKKKDLLTQTLKSCHGQQ